MAIAEADLQTVEDAALRRRRRWGMLFGWMGRRISYKIIIPYVVIILMVAVLATYAVTRLLASSLEDRLLNQLLDAGRKANDGMVEIEEAYLGAFRSMAFTEGVEAALAQGDIEYLKRALQPIQYTPASPLCRWSTARGGVSSACNSKPLRS